jgi:ketosteroid isomerase-like protein
VTPEDELAIRDLVARYADAVCRRDPDAWISNWAEDCEWDLGGGRVTRGRQSALDLWLSATERYPWVAQVVTTGIIEGSGDTATGRWYLLEFNHLPDGEGVLHLGHYTDAYVRTAEGWKFAKRALHMIYRGAMDPGVVVPLPAASS